MTSLDVLDPTRPDDPRFDPHGAHGERVRRAALARAAAHPSAPGRNLFRPSAVLASGAAVALVAAVLILTTAGSSPDARAALAQAEQRMATVGSGVVTVTHDGRGGGYAVNEVDEVRFDGVDLEWVTRARLALPDGRTITKRETFREVDGIGYLRDDTKPDARFETLGSTSDRDFPHQLVKQVGKQSLVELARRADDLTTRSAGSTTVFRATATAGAVFDAAPTAAARAPGGAWRGNATLEVTVGPDGFVRQVQVDSAHDTTTTQFADLGKPQAIPSPR